jgi:corrinoid protein of di/trimethylamine methyltransferase
MITWKSNLEETKQRYINWWNHKGIILNMWEHFQEGVKPHADVPMPPAPKDLNQKWFDPLWRAEYLDWYVAHSSLMADMLPVANTQLGPGSLAAILGGVFEGGEDTIWIHPDPNYTDEIRFDPNHPNYLLHKELLKACKAKAQGHYYVGMPDLMEGLDVLAAIKGTDKVLLDTVMQPEVLEQQMQQINDIYFQVFDELYDIIREGDEMAFCYFSSWAPGKMSKLQSDISTMISEDDYRRFVQPFIREQCQKIDYTLYHLDGVGAMHHLPALLEIEELNAIQWTPGVGEPQGGSPKWYDLYRKILDGGKSIMACWVTLDELRPLLDNIGGNGVHIEMDFHNEREVEQALRIVEEYQDHETEREVEEIIREVERGEIEKRGERREEREERIILSSGAQEQSMAFSEQGKHVCTCGLDHDISTGEKILILDGAMGTMIQQYGLQEEHFREGRFLQHDKALKGCNDLLSLTCPYVISDIHRRYLDAGADIIETNTFNAQRISMGDYGLQDYCREMNLAACTLARAVADEYTAKNPDKPRYVVGSVGPTSKTCSMATSGEEPLRVDVLRSAYAEQIGALVDGGVDGILIETIFDVKNAEVAIEAAETVMQQKHRELPIMLSFSVATPDGHNMLGQSIPAFIASLEGKRIFSVGLNCLSDVTQMTALVQQLASQYPYRISLYPNAGFPDRNGQYEKSPQSLLSDLWPLIEGHWLNIVGGCCGTTDQHIQLMAKAVEPVEGVYLSPHVLRGRGGADVSGYENTIKNDMPQAEGNLAPSCPCPSVPPHAPSLFQSILDGKSAEAAEATRAAVEAGRSPQDLINNEMIRAMGEVGQRFQDGKAFVPQLLMAGRAMKAGLEILKPMMTGQQVSSMGKVVIGTVKGDLHDIGKNLVASMLEGCGFEVVNIGIDVSADTFIEEVKKNEPDILCMSALLTTTMGYMKEVIEALERSGIRDKVKVMVGGAPVTQGFADEIGADGYSDNANTAVQVAKQLLGK